MGREKKGAVGVKRYEMDVKYHGILLGDRHACMHARRHAKNTP